MTNREYHKENLPHHNGTAGQSLNLKDTHVPIKKKPTRHSRAKIKGKSNYNANINVAIV